MRETEQRQAKIYIWHCPDCGKYGFNENVFVVQRSGRVTRHHTEELKRAVQFMHDQSCNGKRPDRNRYHKQVCGFEGGPFDDGLRS